MAARTKGRRSGHGINGAILETSDTIRAYSIKQDGSLSAVSGSPFAANGGSERSRFANAHQRIAVSANFGEVKGGGDLFAFGREDVNFGVVGGDSCRVVFEVDPGTHYNSTLLPPPTAYLYSGSPRVERGSIHSPFCFSLKRKSCQN